MAVRAYKGGGQFLMSEVPLYAEARRQADRLMDKHALVHQTFIYTHVHDTLADKLRQSSVISLRSAAGSAEDLE